MTMFYAITREPSGYWYIRELQESQCHKQYPNYICASIKHEHSEITHFFVLGKTIFPTLEEAKKAFQEILNYELKVSDEHINQLVTKHECMKESFEDRTIGIIQGTQAILEASDLKHIRWEEKCNSPL